MQKSKALPIIKDILSIALLASISLSLAAISHIKPDKNPRHHPLAPSDPPLSGEETHTNIPQEASIIFQDSAGILKSRRKSPQTHTPTKENDQ